jgi:hypothetical protein
LTVTGCQAKPVKRGWVSGWGTYLGRGDLTVRFPGTQEASRCQATLDILGLAMQSANLLWEGPDNILDFGNQEMKSAICRFLCKRRQDKFPRNILSTKFKIKITVIVECRGLQ